MDAATTVMAPLTSPAGVMVPVPATWRKRPFTGARPNILLFNETVDRDGSRIHAPASAASFSSFCGAGAVICSDGAMVVSYRCRDLRVGPGGRARDRRNAGLAF